MCVVSMPWSISSADLTLTLTITLTLTNPDPNPNPDSNPDQVNKVFDRPPLARGHLLRARRHSPPYPGYDRDRGLALALTLALTLAKL